MNWLLMWGSFRQIHQQLSKAAFRDGVILEEMRKRVVAQWFWQTLTKSFPSTTQ